MIEVMVRVKVRVREWGSISVTNSVTVITGSISITSPVDRDLEKIGKRTR